MARIIWSPRSLQHIDSAIDYISLDSPSRAQDWALSIFDATEKLKEFPFSGREVPELNNTNIREIVKGNYRIVYEIGKKNIEILAVRNFAENKIFDE